MVLFKPEKPENPVREYNASTLARLAILRQHERLYHTIDQVMSAIAEDVQEGRIEKEAAGYMMTGIERLKKAYFARR
jgi:DNA-binding transcriptional MerR regulator